MSYRLEDIEYETKDFWVLRDWSSYKVFRTGATHSTRVAIIGLTYPNALQVAKNEADRRQRLLDEGQRA